MAVYSGGVGTRADVRMDYEVVQAMADGFRAAADQLHAVDRALEAAIVVLKASAFVGMVGNLGLSAYLENIRPNVTRLAATCDELHHDLIGAIASLRDGDHSGSLRFVSGDVGHRPVVAGSSHVDRRAASGIDGMLYNSAGQEYSGDPSAVDVVFVNGIDTDFNGFQEGLSGIKSGWGSDAQIAGIFNAPFSNNSIVNKIVDSAQGFGDRVQAHLGLRAINNKAVENLKDVIRANAQGDRTLELVGYSQGGAILSAALNDLYREDPNLVNFVNVTTFGSFGFNYPPGPSYHFYVHKWDPIPIAGQALAFTPPLMASPGDILRYYGNLTVLDNSNPDLPAHDLTGYTANMNGFRQEEQRLHSGGVISQTFRRAVEIAESQTIPLALLGLLR